MFICHFYLSHLSHYSHGHGYTFTFFPSLFFPLCLFASIFFFLHILVTKENMNIPELNIQESVISSMTPCKGTQIHLFFFFFFPSFLKCFLFYAKQPETTPIQIYQNDIDDIDDIDKGMLQF